MTTPLPPSFEDTGLRHSLKQRHMSMIALGGVIGAGLFVGSKVIIASAGPATVISFLITGLLVVLVMKMLGEMAVAMPRTGSFYEYARLALGDMAGFLTGWMYWYFWVIVVAIEAVAGAEIIRTWFPDLPLWVISLGLMIILTLSNLVSVRSYGEIEFWFASVKVTVILVFLVLGTCFVLGFWPSATPGLTNLTAHGGFAPNGIAPVLSGAVVATGFYFGAEVVTIAAAEAKEPGKAVARATNSVITRVLVFYIGSVLLVVMIIPWNAPEMATPYVSAMTAMGLPAAGQIMQVVILTAVLSALNSGLYASSRMLFALTREGDAPQALARLNGKGVPVNAILFSTLFGYGAVVMAYLSPEMVFAFLVNSYGTVALFVYLVIAVSQVKLRRKLEAEGRLPTEARMWAFPWLSYCAVAGMIAVLSAMAFIPDQRLPLAMGLASLTLALGAYALRRRHSQIEGRVESCTL